MLPKGWTDLLRQILLFCGAYWLYRLVRGEVDDRPAVAFENARHIVGVERSLGLFGEPSVHRWAEAHAWIADAASWLYVNSHFTVTTFALAYLYLRRNEHFYFVRNMFMVAMTIALAGYLLFPTAPPRLMPELGFADPVADFTGVDADTSNLLVNPYAAVPSMHVAFALMLAFPMARSARHGAVRAVWLAYPALVTFVVVATANHWWFDAFLGGATAAVSALAAQALLARARPDAWAWRPTARTARA
jgi:hypothetical protein